jgi:hypothetical protein
LDGPIFIIGSVGCGSTLLRLALDSHERIAIPHETGFMRAEQAQKFIPFWPFGGRWYARLGLTEEELDAHLGAFYGGLFRQYAERRGKARWGDRTLWHVWHVDELARLFPDAVFAGVVRHPGGSAASNMRRHGLTQREATDLYSRTNAELVRQGARLGDRFMLVRYEDLALHPEPVVRELLEWLGEAPDGVHLDADAIDVARVTRWGARIREPGRERLRKRVGPLAEFFGYTVEDPERLNPLATGGERRWLLDGRAVAARIERFPGLDLDREPDVPIVERRYRPGELGLHVIQPAVHAAPPLPRARPPLRRFAAALLRVLPRRLRALLRRLL